MNDDLIVIFFIIKVDKKRKYLAKGLTNNFFFFDKIMI